jgi:uncharacterized membrane protein
VEAELIVLRVVHIVGGMFWVGSGLFTTFFLMPALAQAGPVTAHVTTNLQKRRLFLILPTVALLTILSGARLMAIVSGGFSPAYFATMNGRTYAASGLAAIVAFLLSVAVSRPGAVRIARLAQSVASDEMSKQLIAQEIRAVQRRVTWSGTVAVVLLLVAAIGMAIARYM